MIEQEYRRRNLQRHMQDADYLIVHCRWEDALKHIESIRSIVLAEIVAIEHEQIKAEIDVQRMRENGL